MSITPPLEGFRITDIPNEMEHFGRQIFKANPQIYTDKVTNVIKRHINKMMPDASDEEKEVILFRSVYDYWAYGNDIMGEFYFRGCW